MFINDVILTEKNLTNINKRKTLSIIFIPIFILNILLSIGYLVYAVFFAKLSQLNTYLFGITSIVISIVCLILAIIELKKNVHILESIKTNASYKINETIEVNAEHKHNLSTIFSLICACICCACMIAVVIIMALKLDLLSLYILPMMFVLTTFSLYQAIMGVINDKLYRQIIFDKQ